MPRSSKNHKTTAPFVSVFDLFRIGIGPSSSHTVGPMRAAGDFLRWSGERIDWRAVDAVSCDLYGSLALTGVGHGTDVAVTAGLSGAAPETVDPDDLPRLVDRARTTGRIRVADVEIGFDPANAIIFHKLEFLPGHPNGLTFHLWRHGEPVLSRTYYSVGGGFIRAEGDEAADATAGPAVPFVFRSSEELLALSEREQRSIAELARANEAALRSAAEIEDGLNRIWTAMRQCVERGLRGSGTLPGGLAVKRRAAGLHAALIERDSVDQGDPLRAMEWVNLYALAVNEENAAGGRVVTAPTNGAAGIIPAVLHYYDRFVTGASQAGIHTFLLTAAAIGSIIKRNASISGADVGCQGEVGSASAMAAAGLAAALGGSPRQVENAAEIALEHNLGLTCDPIGGLVQIPCIERNAVASVKAVNAARLALHGDGTHRVSLDQAIETMRQTGRDMKRKYKETSTGGLAVNVPEC
ncbi:L-serine dehydratase [Aliidongia dinghuensis]|uniref:L-serine dehydratase n=1 Tax=Aliidongia dinghuensis TaxID=1867774 RepID=A0A8J2YUX3_9PROT|nr:L-serine ammonia-lyase [Aliidongia dinghuensis]GGF24729.1 L-serine dehydratase [Aliidongia dinghuensis]